MRPSGSSTALDALAARGGLVATASQSGASSSPSRCRNTSRVTRSGSATSIRSPSPALSANVSASGRSKPSASLDSSDLGARRSGKAA